MFTRLFTTVPWRYKDVYHVPPDGGSATARQAKTGGRGEPFRSTGWTSPKLKTGKKTKTKKDPWNFFNMEYDESILVQRVDDVKATEALDQQHMTLHCSQCNAVLGDSVGVCGEIKCMDSIMCSSEFTSSFSCQLLFQNQQIHLKYCNRRFQCRVHLFA